MLQFYILIILNLSCDFYFAKFLFLINLRRLEFAKCACSLYVYDS